MGRSPSCVTYVAGPRYKGPVARVSPRKQQDLVIHRNMIAVSHTGRAVARVVD